MIESEKGKSIELSLDSVGVSRSWRKRSKTALGGRWNRRGRVLGPYGAFDLAEAGYLEEIIDELWVVEGKNLPALESLGNLASHYSEDLAIIMSHPTITDGISEQEAKILATLHTSYERNRLDRFLDPEQVTVEERTIILPLAGEVELTVISARPDVYHAMDLLEHSVRTIEEFMSFPFPRRQIIYLFRSERIAERSANYGAHVSVDPTTWLGTTESFQSMIAHEAGHYYWSGMPRWMEEGGAILLDAVVANGLNEHLDTAPCAIARNIAEFKNLGNDANPIHVDLCHYSLGERLFGICTGTWTTTVFGWLPASVFACPV